MKKVMLMESLLKKTVVFDSKKININHLIQAKHKKTNETYKGMINCVAYHFIEIAYFIEEETEIGMEGKQEGLTLEIRDLEEWELTSIETNQILDLNDLTKEEELIRASVSQFVILKHKTSDEKYCGMITYATEDLLEFTYVASAYYQAEVRNISLTKSLAKEWEIEILCKAPFENNDTFRI